MKISIPFQESFREAMLSGVKSATTRTKAYGKSGDTFEEFGAQFVLWDVYKHSLGVIAANFYQEEGFATRGEFIECWKQLHPRNGYVPEQQVHLHLFRKVAP